MCRVFVPRLPIRFRVRSIWMLSLPVPALLLLCGLGDARANPVLPESEVLTHVQPATSPEPSCQTTITHCEEIVNSIPDLGLVEFQLFVYPTAYEQEHLPISTLEADLMWPDSWRLVGSAVCNEGWGSLVGRHLSLEWSCPVISGQLFLAATLVFETDAPGKLYYWGG